MRKLEAQTEFYLLLQKLASKHSLNTDEKPDQVSGFLFAELKKLLDKVVKLKYNILYRNRNLTKK